MAFTTLRLRKVRDRWKSSNAPSTFTSSKLIRGTMYAGLEKSQKRFGGKERNYVGFVVRKEDMAVGGWQVIKYPIFMAMESGTRDWRVSVSSGWAIHQFRTRAKAIEVAKLLAKSVMR